MIRFRARELLEQKGKTKYWLGKQMGMSSPAVDKMIKGKTVMIRFETIEALCQVLECTPNDLFEITDE